MSDVPVSLSTLPIESVLGPLLLGVCINAFFYGFSVLQFVQYRARLFRDSLPTQLLVSWTFLIDTAHTVALCWMMWSYVVDNFANTTYLFSAPWPFTATPTFLAITSAPIQFYFARRVWKFSQSPVLYWTIMALSVANTTMGIVATAFAFTHADVHDFKLLLPVIDSWLGLGVLCDGLISCCLICYLVRGQTGFRRHQRLRDRVAQVFIESSALTAIFALADLIVYSSVPTTNYHIILGMPMGRVYTCTLLAMLNARLKLREDEARGIKESHSYERRLQFANAFHNLKCTPEVRVSVSIREETEDISTEPEDRQSISRTTTKVGDRTSTDIDQKGPGSIA
ncbi:hypothetical protein L226DRAFT_531638 [Lentinus tigrinus ALCF2SS1-7]|uniref:uncharacterized protein n=1 Tax=Lentinus tigrinus ALCF2SS1-7 TaxID=1328758 RepID=UPI001165CF4D|nr:hypothetical protein L226DRAFT_531638 [Lentinus tigrinus ALCF2SS1-7]